MDWKSFCPGLFVLLVAKKDLKEGILRVADEETMPLDDFLCVKSYNASFVDTIAIAVEYEAFYVTEILSDLQSDWRFPRKSKAFLKANPELHVDFSYDSTGFHVRFADGVEVGEFTVTAAESPKIAGSHHQLPDGWISDGCGSPELAVVAVDCDGRRQTVLAILGVEKEPLLQQAASLCSQFNFGEEEWMSDWR